VDLWDLTRLLLRRWYFAVPMLAVTVTVVVLAAQQVSPDYKSTGYMQLIPAPSTGKVADPKAKPRPANPWLDLGYAALANAAIITVTDPTSLDKLKADGYSDSVTIVLNERTPLFEIEAVGSTKIQATETVQRVIKLLQNDVASKQRQYNTMPEDTISTLIINDGNTPSLESGKVKRLLIVAAGLGVLLTTAATIALDYWLRRRSRLRDGEPGDDATDEPMANGAKGSSSVGSSSVSASASAGVFDSVERTRVLRPQQSSHANGNVYSGDRQKAEARAVARPGTVNGTPANGASAPANGTLNGTPAKGTLNGTPAKGTLSGTPANGTVAAAEPPIDATVVLPMPHQPRRSADGPRRSQDKRP
jgi:hypothetical protein